MKPEWLQNAVKVATSLLRSKIDVEEQPTTERHRRVFVVRFDPNEHVEFTAEQGLPKLYAEWPHVYDYREGYILCVQSITPRQDTPGELIVTYDYDYLSATARAEGLRLLAMLKANK